MHRYESTNIFINIIFWLVFNYKFHQQLIMSHDVLAHEEHSKKDYN